MMSFYCSSNLYCIENDWMPHVFSMALMLSKVETLFLASADKSREGWKGESEGWGVGGRKPISPSLRYQPWKNEYTHTHTHQLLLKTFLRVSRNPKAPRKRPSNQTYKIKMDMNGRDRNSWKWNKHWRRQYQYLSSLSFFHFSPTNFKQSLTHQLMFLKWPLNYVCRWVCFLQPVFACLVFTPPQTLDVEHL